MKHVYINMVQLNKEQHIFLLKRILRLTVSWKFVNYSDNVFQNENTTKSDMGQRAKV